MIGVKGVGTFQSQSGKSCDGEPRHVKPVSGVAHSDAAKTGKQRRGSRMRCMKNDQKVDLKGGRLDSSGNMGRSAVLRQGLLLVGLSAGPGVAPPASFAIQGLTAGRIPGIEGPDAEGYFLYTRPEGKSGGHGVGWSEIPRYSFKVPPGWDEKPVSIADLGGTEIDLRYANEEEGSALVVVAPVLRFMDVGYNANVTIKQIGPPDRIIAGFAPELYGKPLLDGDILDTQEFERDGLPYYMWSVKPHHLVTATAVGNRLFILSTTANSRQWRRAEKNLKKIAESFTVPNLA
eukprot:jgi/Picsp_1/2922/NSC_01147-R1_psbp domain-containing protein chloroplastic-like